jgi:hypothetical protein
MAGKTARETEEIPTLFTMIPVLALFSNYGWGACLIYVGTEGNMPVKHCSRWDRLVDRAAGLQAGPQNAQLEPKEV